MSKRKAPKEFAEDPDNRDFLALIELAGGFGWGQQDVAKLLDISPGQVSRVISGERHAARQHIRKLRKELKAAAARRQARGKGTTSLLAGVSPFAIDNAVVGGLSPSGAIEAFRSLLWARATDLRLPTTDVTITAAAYEADGGIDASIRDGAPRRDPDGLLDPGTRFQIKTGHFTPWRSSTIERELFGKKPAAFENLGPGVQQCLATGHRFVLVCFGVDLLDGKLRTAEANLATAFRKCGYPDVALQVWGQTELLGLFNQYLSLCLRLRGHDHFGIRSRQSWERDDDMQPLLRLSPEQEELLQELRDGLRGGKIGHLRLIGEPGVGKTRFALEITQPDDLSSLTLYVKDSEAILRSPLINELMEPDSHRCALLVVDECPPKDRAEIWNVVRPVCDRIRLITIDHGPDTSYDDKMRVVPVDPTGEAQIISILIDHGVGKSEARRWSEFCEGCPRVAHVLGENLTSNPTDLLRPPATVEVWNRFVIGRDDAGDEDVLLRQIVLRHVSLFNRFGLRDPVEHEARFIAKLAGACDPRLTWTRFQSIVLELKKRRILQGETTLYITPRLLHVHLYREFWELHGEGFDIAARMDSMPPSLWRWFVQMLRYAHDVPAAERAVERLLGPNGRFPSAEFPNDQLHGDLVRMLAETSPKATLRCIQRTIGPMSLDSLRGLTRSGHSVVSALAALAVWDDCFQVAARLLFHMAEAEDTKRSSHATGTLPSLFVLTPGMAATEAGPNTRIEILREALSSNSAKRRRLAVDVCTAALRTSHSMRFVGPEHQGIRRTVQFWIPATYGELWDAYRAIWDLLAEAHLARDGEERGWIASALIESAWSTLQIKSLAPHVVETLERLSSDSTTNVKELVEMLKRQIRHPASTLSKGVRERILEVCRRLDGSTFQSRLKRLVKYGTNEDYFDAGKYDGSVVEKKLSALAVAALDDAALLEVELPWLVCEDSSPTFVFGFFLGTEDKAERLLPAILQVHEQQGANARRSLLCGYLHSIFRRDVGRWESVLLELAQTATFAPRFSELAVNSGVSDRIAKRAVERYRDGLDSGEQIGQWGLGHRSRQLSQPIVEDIVRLQLEEGSGGRWSEAVQVCDSYFLRETGNLRLPESLIFDVLTHRAIADGYTAHEVSYSWSRLAHEFVTQFPRRTWDMFGTVLKVAADQWTSLGDLDTNQERVLSTLLRKDPKSAWRCITEAYRSSDGSPNGALQHWLADGGHRAIGDDSPGPIAFVPKSMIFRWVDQDIDHRGYWIARTLPKTFDISSSGRMTREFVQRYGRNEIVADTVTAHFHSRGWCGKATDRFRKLRSDAREWRAREKDPVVRQWLDRYVDSLSADIEREEVDEERRF